MLVEVRRLKFAADGWVPNNPHLPVLLYRNAVDFEGSMPAALFEEIFQSHGWEVYWTGSVHAENIYHSMAHEVIGIVKGDAVLLIGGAGGRKISVDAGDAIMLPAGTGHCQLRASPNFLAIGAYPIGCSWDVCDDAPSNEMAHRIATLCPPSSDPVLG